MATKTPVDDDALAKLLPGQSVGTSTEEEGNGTSLLDLILVLVEGRHLILWVTAGCAIIGLIVSLLMPKQYTATVVLVPPHQNLTLGAQLASQLGSLGPMAALAGGGGTGSLLKNPNDMFVGLLKSRTVEDAMIQHFGLMQEYHKKYLSDARKKFERYATVDGNAKDGLIHISIEDHDPRRAAELANGYVDRFRDLSEHLAISEAGERRLFFEQQLKQANQNLADAEEALKETEQKTGLIQLDGQARALIESAAALRAQISAKEVQIQGMQTYATGENSQLMEAQMELGSLRAQLARLGGNEGGVDSIIVPKGQMTAAGLEYVRRLRDVKYYETIFDVLARQFELAKLDEAKEGALIQVVDPAIPPDKKSFPKVGFIVSAATAVGLILGTFLVVFQAALKRMESEPYLRRKLDRLRYFGRKQSRIATSKETEGPVRAIQW